MTHASDADEVRRRTPTPDAAKLGAIVCAHYGGDATGRRGRFVDALGAWLARETASAARS